MPIYDLHLYSQEINKNQDGVRVEHGQEGRSRFRRFWRGNCFITLCAAAGPPAAHLSVRHRREKIAKC